MCESVCVYIATRIQHANPGLYFSSLFEVVSQGTLWDCGCVSPTQTHTLAPKEQGITEEKGRGTLETVGGEFLPLFPSGAQNRSGLLAAF